MVVMLDAADFAGLTREQQHSLLRRRLAAVPQRDHADHPVLPVPPALAPILPDGGIPRGAVTYTGAMGPLIGIIAAATAAGRYAAIVGIPHLGLLSAAEMNADLSRLALIPDPGPDPLAVLHQLVDGVDLVIAGPTGLTVSPTRFRPLLARTASKESSLILAGVRRPGTVLDIGARVIEYSGLYPGHGLLRSVRYTLEAYGKSGARSGEIESHPGTPGRMEWSAVSEVTVSRLTTRAAL